CPAGALQPTLEPAAAERRRYRHTPRESAIPRQEGPKGARLNEDGAEHDCILAFDGVAARDRGSRSGSILRLAAPASRSPVTRVQVLFCRLGGPRARQDRQAW